MMNKAPTHLEYLKPVFSTTPMRAVAMAMQNIARPQNLCTDMYQDLVQSLNTGHRYMRNPSRN